jgi:hypothetical protein
MAEPLTFTGIIMTDLSYLLPSLLGVFLCAFWMRGYFTPYLRVRTSMGKKVLVIESLEHKTIWHDGIVKGANLQWGKEGNEKNPLRTLFDFKKDYLYDMLNVKCIDFDGATNSFLPHGLTAKNLATIEKIQKDPRLSAEDVNDIYGGLTNAVEGFSQGNVEAMVVEAKFRPALMDNKLKLLIICVLVGIAVAGIAAYFGYNNGHILNSGFYPDIQSIKSQLDTLKQICGPAAQQAIATH